MSCFVSDKYTLLQEFNLGTILILQTTQDYFGKIVEKKISLEMERLKRT
jgi:hypothetical protein